MARHLVERYGIDEVSQWYFEVWNEPNLDFWAGSPRQQTYWKLYEHTARALKRVDSGLRVGGRPRLRRHGSPDFIRFTSTQHIPVDFISTHVYGDDTPKDFRIESAGSAQSVGLPCRGQGSQGNPGFFPPRPAVAVDRVQRKLRQSPSGDGRTVHGSVARRDGAPVRWPGAGYGVLDVLGRVRGGRRGEDALLRRFRPARRRRHPKAILQRLRAAAPAGGPALQPGGPGSAAHASTRRHACPCTVELP